MRRSADSTRSAWRGMGEAWTVLSTIIAGVGIWGAIGYGLDHVFGTRPVLFVIGVLIGHFGAIYLIYVRAMNQQREESNRAA